MKDNKCWICGRTSKEVELFDIDIPKGKGLMEIAPEENRDKYCHGLSLCLLKKNIWLCHICNGLITIIFENQIQDYHVAGEVKLDCDDLRLELD